MKLAEARVQFNRSLFTHRYVRGLLRCCFSSRSLETLKPLDDAPTNAHLHTTLLSIIDDYAKFESARGTCSKLAFRGERCKTKICASDTRTFVHVVCTHVRSKRKKKGKKTSESLQSRYTLSKYVCT